MISKFIGAYFKKNTRTKSYWLKLAVAIVLSNIFFFLIFSGTEKIEATKAHPPGWVEVHVKAELLTPFQMGKKVLLISHEARKKLNGLLLTATQEPNGHHTVLMHENEAEIYFKHENWDIVPFMKNMKFAKQNPGVQHEIRY